MTGQRHARDAADNGITSQKGTSYLSSTSAGKKEGKGDERAAPQAVAVVDGFVDLAGAGVAGVGEALEVEHQDARQRVQLHHLACRHRLRPVSHLVPCARAHMP